METIACLKVTFGSIHFDPCIWIRSFRINSDAVVCKCSFINYHQCPALGEALRTLPWVANSIFSQKGGGRGTKHISFFLPVCVCVCVCPAKAGIPVILKYACYFLKF